MNKLAEERLNKVESLLTEAYDLAILLIEEEARSVLYKCSNLDEFIMAMVRAFFTTKKPIKNCPDYLSCDGCLKCLPKCAVDLLETIEDLNEELKVKGQPMRFTASSPVVTNWGLKDE